jgi:Ca2+-binding EF-hand superfamily protein
MIVVAPVLGVRPQQSAQAFRSADTNHDGVLSRQEMANFSDFQYADLNHDGRIDPYEMQQYLGNSRAGVGPREYFNANLCFE